MSFRSMLALLVLASATLASVATSAPNWLVEATDDIEPRVLDSLDEPMTITTRVHLSPETLSRGVIAGDLRLDIEVSALQLSDDYDESPSALIEIVQVTDEFDNFVVSNPIPTWEHQTLSLYATDFPGDCASDGPCEINTDFQVTVLGGAALVQATAWVSVFGFELAPPHGTVVTLQTEAVD